MTALNYLSAVDGDEISLVPKGANGRRILLRKEDDLGAELEDRMSVPWDHEGSLMDDLRKEGVDESTIEATVAAVRLLKSAEGDLPDVVVEKLGSQLYPSVNKPLNNLDGSDNPSDSVNDDGCNDLSDAPAVTAMAKAGGLPLEKADDDPDEDEDDDSHENDSDGNDVAKADLSTAGRKAMAARGLAQSDGSYPIPNVGYLKRAIRAFGRAGNKAGTKAWIIRRAKALGRTDLLPANWGAGGNVNKEEGGTMSEGTAVSVPIRKDDGEWDYSGVPDENRAFFATLIKESEESHAKSEQLRKELAEERDSSRLKGYVQKAEGYKALAEDPAEFGAVLKEIADNVSDETMTALEKVLDAAEEAIEKGDLFKELGRENLPSESKGDAWEKINKMADDLVEKSDGDGLTKESAIARVLGTQAGAALYAEYLAEEV